MAADEPIASRPSDHHDATRDRVLPRRGRSGRPPALSFGYAAAVYHRVRPGYPADAVDWLLPAGARQVLDLATGTGQLARDLVTRGLDVVAVEPSDEMRARLPASGIRVLAGTAEDIPLPAASVDAVLVGQAWHWFQVDRAVPEVARVLRPGGQLGLAWHVLDPRVDWAAELGVLMHGGNEHDTVTDAPVVGVPFPAVERRDFHWQQAMSRDTLIELVSSHSYVIMLAPSERDQLLGEVERVLDSHPSLARADTFGLPYVTRCARTRKPA